MKTKKIKLLFTASVIISAVAFSSCTTTDVLTFITSADFKGAYEQTVERINKLTETFTPENEYYIGRSVAAAVISKYPLEKESDKVNAYLNNICTTLTVNSPLPYLYKGYFVAVLDSDEINAISSPGGHILISRGLIESCKSEDELAAVIAHEIAHIQLKHSIKVIETSRVASASLDAAKAVTFVIYDVTTQDSPNFNKEAIRNHASTLWDVQSELMNTLVENGYSQSQEFDADKYALQLMIDAGYNPSAMSEMLKNIQNNSTNGGWNKTHPSAKARNKKVKKELKNLKNQPSYSEVRNERFNEIKIGL